MLDEFEETIGEPPSFFHLNDSEGELGSNKDRHVLIGDGHIGKEPFGWLMQDRRSDGHSADSRDAAAELRDRGRRRFARPIRRENDEAAGAAGEEVRAEQAALSERGRDFPSENPSFS